MAARPGRVGHSGQSAGSGRKVRSMRCDAETTHSPRERVEAQFGRSPGRRQPPRVVPFPHRSASGVRLGVVEVEQLPAVREAGRGPSHPDS